MPGPPGPWGEWGAIVPTPAALADVCGNALACLCVPIVAAQRARLVDVVLPVAVVPMGQAVPPASKWIRSSKSWCRFNSMEV